MHGLILRSREAASRRMTGFIPSGSAPRPRDELSGPRTTSGYGGRVKGLILRGDDEAYASDLHKMRQIG
jgi:hypothetical protein